MSLPVRDPAPEAMEEAAAGRRASCSDAYARRIAARVRAGDETAFRELYDRYQDRIFRLALVIGQGDERLADEAVQAAFLTAASKLKGIESEAHLWNWLARVARQQIGKLRRRNLDYSAFVPLEELPEIGELNEADHELEQRLDGALLVMEAEDRTVIEWFYFDKLSHKAIGQRLGASAKAVSCRLERARAKLRTLLAKDGLK